MKTKYKSLKIEPFAKAVLNSKGKFINKEKFIRELLKGRNQGMKKVNYSAAMTYETAETEPNKLKL